MKNLETFSVYLLSANAVTVRDTFVQNDNTRQNQLYQFPQEELNKP